MQSILSIDASSDPAIISVTEVSGGAVRIVEQSELAVGRIFLDCHEASLEPNDQEQPVNIEPENEDPGENGEVAIESSPTSVSVSRLAAFFNAAINQIKSEWSSSILIIPANDYLSLNIDLPFEDAKSIARILELEVQDLVPFDISDFLVGHCSIAEGDAGQFETHVSILPKNYLRLISQAFTESGFEPYIISTPASALAAVFHIAPDYFPDDCAVILAQDPNYCMVVRTGGLVRTDRIIQKRMLGIQNGHLSEGEENLICTEFKLTLSQIEQKYQTRIDTVYVTGDSLSDSLLQRVVARTIERFSPEEFIESEGSTQSPELSGISTVFPQDMNAPKIMTNFRIGEFSYSPQLRELIRGFQSLTPYVVGIVVAAVLMFSSVYLLREHKSSSLRDALHQRVAGVIPELSQIEDGKEAESIAVKLRELDSQLRELGSVSSFTPLDALYALSEDLPMSRGIEEISSLNIRNNKVQLRGKFKGVQAIDALESMLKSKSTRYCSFNKIQSTSQKSFSVNIEICENPQ